MSSTTPFKSIKLFNSIAAAAVITASYVTANPAEARNGWIMTINQDNYRVYNKFISRSDNIVTYENQLTKRSGKSSRHIIEVNCSAWTKRSKFDFGWGKWNEILPETVADYSARAMCG